MGGGILRAVRARLDSTRRRVLRRVLPTERFHARYPDELRGTVGGQWETMGAFQLDYLRSEGLEPQHQFLDVGCGLLRAGLHFIRYLEPRHYCGLDGSEDILAAARVELRWADLEDRGAELLHTKRFEAERFGRSFDYALAQSVFSHTNINAINVCLQKIQHVLAPGGRFYATFFEDPAGTRGYGELEHPHRGGWVTRTTPYSDPFHYGFDLFQWLVEPTALEVEYVGEWGHSSGQKMLRFTREPA
jgi:SAM-dependent methyltransferase